MNPVQSIKKSENISIENKENNGNTQQATAGSSRSNNTHNLILPEALYTSPIYNRELSLEASPSIDTYGEAISKRIKLITIKVVEELNRLLAKKGKKRYKIEYNQNDAIEDIIRKFLECFVLIIEKFPACKKAAEKIESEIDDDECLSNPELVRNAEFCWNTLILLCAEPVLCSKEQDSFLSTIQLTQNTDDMLIDEVNPLINESIISLKAIKEKCYYSLFKIMMDQELDLKTKFVRLFKYREGREPHKSELSPKVYLDGEPKELELSMMTICKFDIGQEIDFLIKNQTITYLKYQLTEIHLKPLASCICQLQDLINSLRAIKNAPKTIKNLMGLYKVLNRCHIFFEAEIAGISQASQKLSSQSYQDCLMIKTFLFDLKKQVHGILNIALMKRNSVLEKKAQLASQQNSPTLKISKVPVELQKKRKKRRNRSVEHIVFQPKDPPIIEANNGKEKNEIITAKPENDGVMESIIIPTSPREKSVKSRLLQEGSTIFERIRIEGPELKDRKVIEKPEEKVQLESFMEDNQPGVKSVMMTEELHEKSFDEQSDDVIFDGSSDDSLDDIEREANFLMEILRQFYEKDRKEKLEQKEAKIKKATLLLEPEVVKISPIKLSTKHQETLSNLFLENPPNLEISGSEVESLIRILGGRTVGAGGSMVSVFWRNSKKKAGEYEVFHGGDGEGYLKSAWAGRAAEAIRVGVQYGYIAKETIHPHL